MYKTIPEYPKYACSEDGEIINTQTGKPLSKSINQKGYIQHCISIKGKRKIIFPHRIVAELFVDNPENKPYVNHIDGNKQNNNCTNLEWCTNSENVRHAIYVLNMDFAGRNKKAVKCLDTGEIYNSTLEVERKLGIDNAWVSMICNGKKKSAKGLHFAYI